MLDREWPTLELVIGLSQVKAYAESHHAVTQAVTQLQLCTSVEPSVNREVADAKRGQDTIRKDAQDIQYDFC